MVGQAEAKAIRAKNKKAFKQYKAYQGQFYTAKIDKESFDRIMASQASNQERAAVANTVIVNESSLDQLHQEIDNLHLNLCALAAEKSQ